MENSQVLESKMLIMSQRGKKKQITKCLQKMRSKHTKLSKAKAEVRKMCSYEDF